MTNDRRINVRFAPELFDQPDEKRFRERTTFQDLGATLFREWLSGERTVELPPRPRKPPRDPLLEKIGTIRASGDRELIGIVQSVVNRSFEILRRSLPPDELKRLKAAADGRGSEVSSRQTYAASRERRIGGEVAQAGNHNGRA